VAGHHHPAATGKPARRQAPDARFGKLDAVARRIADIDRAPAARPLEIGLDGNAGRDQALAPHGDLARAGAKTRMSRPVAPVRGDGERGIAGWSGSGVRVEHQQHTIAAAKEHVTARLAGYHRQAEHAVIEGARRIEVVGIKDGLEDSGRCNRHESDCPMAAR
jgi:hypothetical protein